MLVISTIVTKVRPWAWLLQIHILKESLNKWGLSKCRRQRSIAVIDPDNRCHFCDICIKIPFPSLFQVWWMACRGHPWNWRCSSVVPMCHSWLTSDGHANWLSHWSRVHTSKLELKLRHGEREQISDHTPRSSKVAHFSSSPSPPSSSLLPSPTKPV